MRGDDDRVEAVGGPVAGGQLDAARVAPDRPRAQPDVHPARELGKQRLHVAAAPARDGPPREPPEPEHPVMVEEADRVRRREVERPLGAVDHRADVSGTRKWRRKRSE